MLQSKKEVLEEIEGIINHCEGRLVDLEKTIKSESNQGVKKIMQDNYTLNKNLLTYYRDLRKRARA